jgi:hypothetical protein
MADIYWGFAVIGLLAAGVFAFSFWLTSRLSRAVCDGIALLVVVGIFTYIRFLWYQPRLTTILPFANLVVLGNWFPISAGALGGLAWHRVPGRRVRKGLFVGALTGASIYSVFHPVLGMNPECRDEWMRDVCLQTTPSTCSPACAATLLRMHGISATEPEMAELCLTRRGTTWMGLYRGLKLKTAGTAWDVEAISCDADDLLRAKQTPLILSVGLPLVGRDEEHAGLDDWGWKEGIGHSVILTRHCRNGRVMMVDPTPGVGNEEWTREDVKRLFRGTALRLVKRS